MTAGSTFAKLASSTALGGGGNRMNRISKEMYSIFSAHDGRCHEEGARAHWKNSRHDDSCSAYVCTRCHPSRWSQPVAGGESGGEQLTVAVRPRPFQSPQLSATLIPHRRTPALRPPLSNFCLLDRGGRFGEDVGGGG